MTNPWTPALPSSMAALLAVMVTAGDSGTSLNLTRVTSGAAVTDAYSSPSASWVDIDSDGDLDLYLTQWPINRAGGAPNLLYRNDGPAGNWLKIELEGSESNRSAIGARITVIAEIQGEARRQLRHVTSRSSWRSSNSLTEHFGLGDAGRVDRIEVAWPSGHVDTLEGPIPANQRVQIEEGIEHRVGAPREDAVQYTVRPVQTDSLVHLRVETTFRGSSDGMTRFFLPSDRFGVSEMHRWIQGVGADADTRLTEVEPGVYAARHEPGAEVEISYTVAYDPEVAGSSPFGPSVGSDHFHFFGSQWMARVGHVKGPRDVEVLLRDGGWAETVGSSYGLGPGLHRVSAPDYDLDYSVIAGGRYRVGRSECRGRPIKTLVHGDFAVPDDSLFPLVSTVVCGQREAFEDFDRPFFTVFVTEREHLEAGAPVLNGFTAFLERAIGYEELRHLLAHEMVHTWLPRTARLVESDRPDAPRARTRWFHEGSTEYLARRILVRQGLVPLSWMVDRTNEDLEKLSYHPYRTMSLDELTAAVREGEYTNHHHRLHYQRGALLALDWDTRIRAATGGERSLLDAIRRVVDRGQASGGRVRLREFEAIFGTLGVDAAGDIDRHLKEGVPIHVDSTAFAPEYDLGLRRVPSFRLGFDLQTLLRTGTIRGLEEGSPAQRAGLRNGMKAVDIDNGVPWLGRWDPSKPTVVTVETEAGKERHYSFDARGPEKRIPVLLPGQKGSGKRH